MLKTPIAIVGGGKTGMACLEFLLSHFERSDLCVFDSRLDCPQREIWESELGADHCAFGPFDFSRLRAAATLVVSPGIDLRDGEWPVLMHSPAHQVMGDVALFRLYCSKPTVGITGTNGKSTVTALVGHFAAAQGLRVAVGGNFGTPALALLADDVDVYVLELSSFQLDLMDEPALACACHLNVSPDHLDRYDSFEDYVHSKKRIFRGAGKAVFNAADILTQPMDLDEQVVHTFDSSLKHPHHFSIRQREGEFVIECNGEVIFYTADTRLKGRHNATNIAAALACAAAMGWDLGACARSMASFNALPHRCEQVGLLAGVTFIDDSKGTNIGATIAAVVGLAPLYKRMLLIAGGVGKEQDFSQLRDVVGSHVALVLLLGRDRELIGRALADAVETVYVNDMREAVVRAYEAAEQGDLVLLSPACASFDMYSGYAARGADFARCVAALGEAA